MCACALRLLLWPNVAYRFGALRASAFMRCASVAFAALASMRVHIALAACRLLIIFVAIVALAGA